MQTILIQLDTDNQASIFDRVVAIDSGVAQIFSCAAVTPETVTSLVHGTIFTRGPADLKHTAIFIGGSSAAAGEALQKKVLKGAAPITVRPGAVLPPADLEATRAEAEKKAGRKLSEAELASYLMYPKVFTDFATHHRLYGDVER